MEKEVTEAEIKRVAGEYLQRMFALFETCHGTSTDSQIDCPRCGRSRGITLFGDSADWVCSWFDCRFRFPPELTPPTPRELEFWNEQRKTEKKIQKIEAAIHKFLDNKSS